MTAYYNEIDPYAAQWLRNLIAAGRIAPGIVDERSIENVTPADLAGFTQCHFFAGIGIWSLALRNAEWPDSRPVWTGSCPCQPFSEAGKGAGFADERHLWPAWFHLISQCEPNNVFGEQVASKAGLGWLDLVQADLESQNYAFGGVDICSAGVGSENGRQRLYFVADADGSGQQGREKQDFSEVEPGFETSRRGDPSRRGANACSSAVAMVGADGVSRMLEPGTIPLVASYPTVVERLRAYGNAINAQAATQIIAAYMACDRR